MLWRHPDRPPGCACFGADAAVIGRRSLLRGAAATVLLAGAAAPAWSASGDYEAMILACIDPRFQDPVHAYAAKRGLAGKYSQFVIAGAAIGVVDPKFADWHKAFWDNLAVSVQLHNIKKVIAIDHRDCGAAALAFGEARVKGEANETEVHREALAKFRKEVGQRQSALAVETGLMALDGSMQMFT